MPPIPALVLGVFAANAFAQTDAVVLDTINVTNHQGLKVKTNVVTTQIKDERRKPIYAVYWKTNQSVAIGGNGTSIPYIRGMGQTPLMLKWTMRIPMHKFTTIKVVIHAGPRYVKIVSVQKGAGNASAGIGQTNGAIVAKTLMPRLLEG